VDVALDNKVALWAAKVLENDSPPDLLINNAAIMNRLAPLWEQDDREFTKLVDANIRGVQNVIRHFVPAMVAKKKGVIVNFSSGWGRSVSPEVALLHVEVGDRGPHEGARGRVAQGDGGGAAESRGDRHRDAAFVLGGRGGELPESGAWAEVAAPFILSLGAKDNGRSLSVPGQEG
jgi:NAD(P)-dependent dehydrogenase (short-subunit alcohol dehydrogenase family)